MSTASKKRLALTTENNKRNAAPDLSADDFRRLGNALVDQIAQFLETIPERPVTRTQTPAEIRSLMATDKLPESGTAPDTLLKETAELLFDHSLHNGHPRFFAYITSSAAPLGALCDLLASAVNSNVGAWDIAPMASEIEAQTVRWLAELIGYSPGCGGLMVSGGNMANIVCFFAARKAKAPWEIRAEGVGAGERSLICYASQTTHTWIQKAADLSGLGTNQIHWIEIDDRQRMDPVALRERITADKEAGLLPFLIVATAGTVSTGSVDPLEELADIATEFGLWLHVDGAYGAFGAALPNASADLRAISKADSVALDPHKWLYSPLEAGCAIVRDPDLLTDAFLYMPEYYHFVDDDVDPRINYYQYGLQNSRGFRALKVWLGLRHIGRDGYVELLEDDIALAKRIYAAADAHPELEPISQELSITTFRYKPEDLTTSDETNEAYLNQLNDKLLYRLNDTGEVFLSNAVIEGRNVLRACIVNFRTDVSDVDTIPRVVVREGRALDAELRG